LIFTVRIAGSARRPLPRPPLRRLPEFTQRFIIEEIPGPEPQAGEGVWEFRYRLRPRPLTPPVKEIPALRFDSYKPGVIPREKGYRTKYAEAIPLTVLPRSEVQPTDIQGAVPAVLPEALYKLVEGPDAVLRRDEPFALPGPVGLVLVFLGVPILCLAWHALWRYSYPDAARQARHRQSRAARKALLALETAAHQATPAASAPVAAIVTDYLRHRWALSAAEPTPQEVATHLEQHGCAGPCARQAAEVYQALDIARFAPASPRPADDLTVAAVRLIRTLEDQP
jgi:hypothetical protein